MVALLVQCGMTAMARGREDALSKMWRDLRQPFTLCGCMKSVHECEWEVFDVGLAGCTVCGRVHRCSANRCAEAGVIETGDAIVCSVTGLCVREKIFVDNEWVDTVSSYGCASVAVEAGQLVSKHHIKEHVHVLLTSAASTRAHVLEQCRWRNKMSSQGMSMINALKQTSCVNLLHVIQSLLERNSLPCSVDERENCAEVAKECTELIFSIINTCVHELQMHLRPSEIRIVVFGLLYLMRSGVSLHGVCVIPAMPELNSLLPPENSLQSIFGFRAKHITDVENKFKFLFRGVDRARMRVLFS